MATILADSFDRVGATLGTGWTEDSGNFSTDGSKAQIDATGLSIATVDASSQNSQFVQVWAQIPNASQNAGIVWRYQTSTLFYMVVGLTTSFAFFRRDGGGYNAIGTYSSSGLGTGTWRRFGVRMVSSQIDFFLEGSYNATLEGPAERITDSGITGNGKSGIISSGNNATGASGPLWDGFHCCDGAAQTIYADVGNSGQTLGTQSDPDATLGYALNHVGLNKGGTLQILTEGTTPIGNGSGTYSIGHAGKFAATGGESFPDYDDDDGGEGSANNANLIIQGVTSGTRTILRETSNVPFFTVRNDASYIMVRGVEWDCTGGAASKLISTVPTNNLGASTEHSIAVDKCRYKLGTATVDDQTAINIGSNATAVRVRYSLVTTTSGRRGNTLLNIDATHSVTAVICRRNVFAGIMQRGFLCGVGPPSGATWEYDHNTYYGLTAAGISASCLEITNGTTVTGTITHKNSIMFGGTEYGTRVVNNATAIGGTVEAHHNGYYGIDTYRGTGVTDSGNEVENVNPTFADVGSTYTWTQSGDPDISVPYDLRPTDAQYRNSADDSFGGVTLDRGALEDFGASVDDSYVFIEDQNPIAANPMSIKTRMIYPEGLDVDSDIQRIYTLVEQKNASFSDQIRCFTRKADTTFGTVTGQWKDVTKGILDRFAYPFYAEAFQFHITGNNTPIFIAAKFSSRETK